MKQVLLDNKLIDAKKEIFQARLVSIVDDDASVRASTLRVLRWSGLRAEAFSCAEEFLRSDFLDRTSCLILDVRMPGMGGLELQRRLAESGRRIPTIFLSGRANEGEEKRALAAGAVDFLRKPVKTDALLQAIHTVLDGQDKK